MLHTMLIKEQDGELKQSPRWDPDFWDPKYANPLKRSKFSVEPLGNFIDDITYGAIIVGKRPRNVAVGVKIISQKEIDFTGVDDADAITVKENSEFDPERARVQKGDILFPRSGVGSLGKNKLTIFDGDYKATVDCFVDIIRLKNINSYFVTVFLKSKPGWYQIFRIINGVGPPNISFDEIRSIKIPLLPSNVQSRIETLYKKNVSEIHYDGLALKKKGKPSANEKLQTARANLENLIRRVEDLIFGRTSTL